MRIGLIVNPFAGGGIYPPEGESGEWDEEVFESLTRIVRILLSDCDVVTCSGAMGEDLLQAAGVPVREIADAGSPEKVEWENGPSRQALSGTNTVESASGMAKVGVEALVIVGGDGTLADAALGIVRSGVSSDSCPILGIGIGTSNVGSLVSLRLRGLRRHGEGGSLSSLYNLDSFVKPLGRPGGFERAPQKGLTAAAYGELVGVAFNDIVIGDTVLATVNGKRTDVNASSFMHGIGKPAIPSPVYGLDCKVTLLEAARAGSPPLTIAKGTEVGQVVASILDGRFVGKAVAGGTCLGDLLGFPAVVAVSDQCIVRVNIDKRDLYDMGPVTSITVSFDEGDAVYISGVREGACLCCDGNPLWEIEAEGLNEPIEIRVSERLVYKLSPCG